jgi:hypothetical protein
MIARRFRRFAVPLVVGVAGLGLTGCSNRSTDAATVTYHDSRGDHTAHISESEFTRELDSLLSNVQFSKLLSASGSYPEANGTTSTDPGVSTFWLTQLIQQTAIDAEAEADHVTVTAQDRADARTQEGKVFSSDAVFSAFSKSFGDKVVEREAQIPAIIRYYETCPSGRFVSHILVKTQAEANAALASINSGQSTFAAVAKAKSIDTTSGKAGGVLGCVTPAEFVAPFQTAAETAPLDVVTAPVKTQFGYHLILVRTWDPVADKTYAQALVQAGDAAITVRINNLKVWVNPRYGTWAKQTNSQGTSQLAVVPPAVPNLRVCREAKGCTVTTTTPTTVPAAAGG